MPLKSDGSGELVADPLFKGDLMRIISKFFDVYDLQHSLRDETRVWNRVTETIFVRKLEGEDYSVTFGNWSGDSFNLEYFYFCGQVYPLFRFSKHKSAGLYDTFDTFIAEKAIAKAKEWDIALGYRFPGDTTEKQFAKLLAKIEEDKVKIQKMFDKFNHPMGHYSFVKEQLPDDNFNQKVPCHVLKFNPKLMGDYPWQEIDDNVYRFHQLIEQFLSGVIGQFEGEPQTVSISDKDRLIAHGFDAVTSFRNMKRNGN